MVELAITVLVPNGWVSMVKVVENTPKSSQTTSVIAFVQPRSILTRSVAIKALPLTLTIVPTLPDDGVNNVILADILYLLAATSPLPIP